MLQLPTGQIKMQQNNGNSNLNQNCNLLQLPTGQIKMQQFVCIKNVHRRRTVATPHGSDKNATLLQNNVDIQKVTLQLPTGQIKMQQEEDLFKMISELGGLQLPTGQIKMQQWDVTLKFYADPSCNSPRVR